MSRVISTIGTVSVGEVFSFRSQEGLSQGDQVQLKTQKPSNAEVYGTAKVFGYRVVAAGETTTYDAVRVS